MSAATPAISTTMTINLDTRLGQDADELKRKGIGLSKATSFLYFSGGAFLDAADVVLNTTALSSDTALQVSFQGGVGLHEVYSRL